MIVGLRVVAVVPNTTVTAMSAQDLMERGQGQETDAASLACRHPVLLKLSSIATGPAYLYVVRRPNDARPQAAVECNIWSCRRSGSLALRPVRPVLRRYVR